MKNYLAPCTREYSVREKVFYYEHNRSTAAAERKGEKVEVGLGVRCRVKYENKMGNSTLT